MGEDASCFDGADLRDCDQEIAQPGGSEHGGRGGEDLGELDRAGRELLLQRRSGATDLVCLRKRAPTLLARSGRDIGTCAARCHAGDSGAAAGRPSNTHPMRSRTGRRPRLAAWGGSRRANEPTAAEARKGSTAEREAIR